MNFFTDPSTALTTARYHQADVRAAFPRRLPRPVLWPRPKRQYGGITAVPAVSVPQPRPEQEPVHHSAA
ncbi:MAG TPA: hypothetical protein VGJ41_14770 [Nocardioides sp.]|jgi:hypothetical protein